MNKWLRKLSAIAGRPTRTVLGLMSGTSMDGIDLALCRVRGKSMSTEVEVLKYGVIPVEETLKKTFHELAYNPETGAGKILRFQAELSEVWLKGIKKQMKDWNVTGDEIDLVASHGQTILHQPDPDHRYSGTLQIVDGDLLAQKLGIITVSDFRQKHIAAGYEGAPVAPLGEVLLFSEPEEDRVLLNLGGIANFTVLKAGTDQPYVPFATDTGPANTLMDAAISRLVPGKSFDESGAFGRTGSADKKLLEELTSHPFFKRPFPKSTGQEDFSWDWVNKCLMKTGPELRTKDLLATLAEFTAQTAGKAILENLESDKCTVYVSGGGWKNNYLIDRLKANMPDFRIISSEELGLNPDAKESALFAVLANELICGEGWINSEGKRFTLGKISLPG